MAPSPLSDSSSSSSWTSPGAGITGGYNGNSQTLRIFIVFFAGLAVYNACELIIMVLLTFHRYRGLYFWSLLIAACGIIPYSLGFLLKFMNITTGNARWAAVVMLTVGWWPMITGQSIVLWSRLHLILNGVRGEKVLRYTMVMILVDVVILHAPTTILTFGSNSNTDTNVFATGYSIMEKIQMIGFFLQEVVLSSIYIVETVKILKTSLRPRTRTTMKQLVVINALIIAMDLALLALESASLYILETLLKGIIYSLKLKLEFAILGKLVKFVGGNKASHDEVRKSSVGFVMPDPNSGMKDRELDVNEFVDLNRVQSDVTHPSRLSESFHSRRKNSRLTETDLEYDIARFRHIEDISRLRGDMATPRSSRTPSLHYDRTSDSSV